MSKLMQILLSLVVAAVAAIAIRTAFDAYHDWSFEEGFNERSAEFAAELRDAVTDAEVSQKTQVMEQMAKERYEKVSSRTTSETQMKTNHMNMILGAYSAQLVWKNICAELDVDISLFVETYEEQNSDVIAAAESYLFKSDVEKQDRYELLVASELNRVAVEIGLDEIAGQINGDWTAVCNLANDFADEIASEMLIVNQMPQVKKHL